MKKSYVVSIMGTFSDEIVIYSDNEASARETALDKFENLFEVKTTNNTYNWDKLEITKVQKGALSD
jgi:hypothetical protein